MSGRNFTAWADSQSFRRTASAGRQRTLTFLSVVPYSSSGRLLDLECKESHLRKKHGIYLDVVTVAATPEDYAVRVAPLYPGVWQKLNLFVLEAHDLALTKLERNFERDRADVAHLAEAEHLKAVTLCERYYTELRPSVIGRESWHDAGRLLSWRTSLHYDERQLRRGHEGTNVFAWTPVGPRLNSFAYSCFGCETTASTVI